MSELVARMAGGLADFTAADWDACAGTDNPFVGHAFLSALEDSGSVGGRTGWSPVHLLIQDAGGGLAAAAPCY
ncbi:MAG TPA: peptidogalycan biosysnthesis protein, partial [Sphingomonas sp.]|uniref:peptidogalycan biosysnthesis protein n=1 Tax=Sphingomonas sp. TaxID=28214 RepID=UPI002EDA48EF